MKHFLLSLIYCFPIFLVAQNTDSIEVVRVVDSLLLKSERAIGEQNYEEALNLIEAAQKTARNQFGEMSEIYATCAHAHGRFYLILRKYTEAEPYCIEAVKIREKVLGKENMDYAKSLSNLATLNYYKGDYSRSEFLFLELIEIWAKTRGKEDMLYAGALNSLANVYSETGDYIKAERLLLEAKEVLAKVLGKEDPNYAMVLNNLATFYGTKRDFSKAVPLLLEAIEIWAKTLGKEDPDYALALNNLGNLYWETGDYGKIESLFLEAKEIRSRNPGKEHPDYALSLYNLAGLYVQKGDYVKAKSLFLEGIEIHAKTLGKDQPEYANFLTGLAVLYIHEGDYDKADSLYSEVQEITEKQLGKRNINYATFLHNRAALYMHKNDNARAEPMFLESLEIMADIVGTENIDYATFLEGLGVLYYNNGNYANAKLRLLEAKEINARVLGKEHQNYASTLRELAILDQKTGNIPASALSFYELNNRVRRLIEKSASYSSEGQMAAYLHVFDFDLALFQSFAQTYPTPALICATYDNALFYNGYLLENTRHLARAIAGADSLTRDTFERWQGCTRRLANEYAKPAVERRYVAETEAEAEGYEKTLTRNLPIFSEGRHVPHWKDVHDRLRTGEAAVEFIHYRLYNPEETDSIIYAALVLLPGDTCPHFVPLCEQRPLDNMLQIEYPDKRYERTLDANSLYSLLWRPIESLMQGVGTVYYAPGGALHSVNFDAIMLNLQGDSTLIDRHILVRLGSTRQLVAPVKADIAGNDALLFGGIRYESDSTAILTQNEKNGVVMRGASMGSLAEPGDSLQHIRALTNLPSTLAEAEYIRQIMVQKNITARMFSGFGASEEAFKHFAGSLSATGVSARVLHLATHGYFFPAPGSSEPLSKRRFKDEPFLRISEHPFLRSGIVLAGGNHAWQTGRPFKADMEDGILTAYEISAMSLSNTELVVLSACETGLGDLSSNEGVYGLQRAFKIAGVQYLIMSLWSVPDDSTTDLMTAFYHNWLDKGMDIPTAFREAQLELKKKNKNPENWAGFVLVR